MDSTSATSDGVTFAVDYPDQPLNRVTTAFRIVVAIPIVVVLAAMSGPGSGVLFLAVLLMLVFRAKYPRWWYDWNLEFWRFENRIVVYLLLLRDEYPSTDAEQAVHLVARHPDVPRDVNRWLPLVKWFLAIPHYVVLAFLWIAVIAVTIVAWFTVLFTGRYPRGLFDFVTGVLRWTNRVVAYAFVLVTDEYPRFALH